MVNVNAIHSLFPSGRAGMRTRRRASSTARSNSALPEDFSIRAPVSDPFAWDPRGTREAWFERVGVSTMKPINAEGRRAYAILLGGTLGSIPLAVVLALLGAGPAWLLLAFGAGLIGAPLWFLWAARGRVKV